MSTREAQLPLLDSEPLRSRPSLRPVIATPPRQADKASKRGRAWIAVNLPLLPLHAAVKTSARTTDGSPVAVVDADRMRRVLCCDDKALRAGIRPGHTFNAAIAICRNVTLLSRNLDAEAALLNELATACGEFTPSVVVEPPNELLLDVRGSLRLFGGATALVEQLRNTLRHLGVSPAIALAPTATSAQWISRCTQASRIVKPRELPQVLADIPIAYLQWPDDVVRRIQRFGVRNVGDLLRLPRAGLARRIGHEHLRALDRALGKDTDIRRAFQKTQTYEDRLAPDFEIETTSLLERMLAPRLERLEVFLRKRASAISELLIELKHREHPPTSVRIGLASPTSDMRHVSRLLHETLSAVRLPEPIREAFLTAPHLLEATASSRHLALAPAGAANAGESGEAAARLLEHLRARLGENAIRILAAKADRRPEAAHTESASTATEAKASNLRGSLAQRPMWLLRKPKLVINHENEARDLAICIGPERIENGWWDGNLIDRDYFVVHSRQGALCWMFQDRTQPAHWYLHGLFA